MYPTSSTPAPLPEAPVVPQGYEPDVESDAPESPRTPRRQRYRRASTLAAPARPQRPLSESETGDHPEPETSPTVQAPQRGVSPLPSVASVGLRTGLTFVQPPTFSTGPKTPPSLGSAAASVLVGPMSVSDALAQIHSLCGGQFYDDGRPKAKVEYRRNFIFATLGLSDEQVASLWANHLVYDGPAYDWYESLVSTQAGKTAAEKWSTLLPEIEKRASSQGTMERAQIRHSTHARSTGQQIFGDKAAPSLGAAAQGLGAAVTSMTNEEKVLQTLEALPVYLLELLPKRDGYVDEWDKLIKDIGDISSRLLLNRYNQQSILDSMYTLSVSEPIQPPTTPRWRNARLDRSPPPPAARTPAPRREPAVRFEDTPRVVPATSAPSPNPFTRPRTPTSQSRDPPPHTPFTPQTPGPVPSVLSRVPPPVGAQRIPDTPEDKLKWNADFAQWKALYRQEPYSLRRPFPLRPGTFEQTAFSCTRCGVADHFSYQCEATGSDVLDDKEQGYRRLVARKLRDERKAGTQPSTPTPQQRVSDTAQGTTRSLTTIQSQTSGRETSRVDAG
ncbi:Retrovirus-related Pol polyprotein from transposon [Ceratobasidium sp. AG-Ba]|nr:Retrovirus-related Pol polyprotein from transposon [Ceratobasidium sp. AG-Ba]